MTVGDRVILNTGPDESPLFDTLGRRPLIGTVIAQDAGPTIATIQWDGGNQRVDIPIGALQQVKSVTTQEAQLVMKYLQLAGIRYESGAGVLVSSKLSPAASGVCLEAFRVSAFQDEANPTFCLATIALDDGKAFMRVPFADPATLSDPATIAELEALGVISVRDGPRSVATN